MFQNKDEVEIMRKVAIIIFLLFASSAEASTSYDKCKRIGLHGLKCKNIYFMNGVNVDPKLGWIVKEL